MKAKWHKVKLLKEGTLNTTEYNEENKVTELELLAYFGRIPLVYY